MSESSEEVDVKAVEEEEEEEVREELVDRGASYYAKEHQKEAEHPICREGGRIVKDCIVKVGVWCWTVSHAGGHLAGQQ